MTFAEVERRIVSVLFADLVGFTALSEQLDAEDVATVQDAYFAAVRETIQRYGGALEKFIGDAAMAVFGATRARDDDAERAVRAGMALIGALEQLEARLGMGVGTLQLRVGVNTGEVVHATAGPDAGRVTGDTVNTAARLQTAARPGSVLIGGVTALSVAETIEARAVGSVELKGKAQPVPVYEAIGVRPQPSREEALGALQAPMIGRDAELAGLHAAIARVSSSRSAERLLIAAPPGVGKSRLLAELARTTTARVLRARVRPQANAPYEAVAELLRAVGMDRLPAALADAGVMPARADVVAAEVDRVLGSAGGPVAVVTDLAAERDARFDAWITALDAATAGPSVWLIEDVHWAGGDLLAFLGHAEVAPTGYGRLVVATARPSLLEAQPAWCDTTRLELTPLAPTDAGALVRALVGTALPDPLVEAVVRRSDGTPLFIEELLRTWASVGVLLRADDGWRLTVEPGDVPLPPTVQAIYAAQLDDLPPDARLVARRGAVAGRRVPLAALGSLDLEGRVDGVETLRRRAFLAGPVSDPVTGEGYAYRHALLRDAGYASLARAERARLHVAMAGWLEAVAGDRVDVVAEAVAEHHASALESLPALTAADHPDRQGLSRTAAAWFERAAEAAIALSAHEAAQRLFSRSVELTEGDAPLDLARRRLRLGDVLAASADLAAGIGEMEAALAAYREALPAAAAEYAGAAYALALAYMQQVRFGEAEQVTESAIARLSGTGADVRAATSRLMALHAWSVAAQGRDDGALAEADEASGIAAAVGDPVLELEVLEHRTAVHDESDDVNPDDWADVARRAVALGRWRLAVTASRVHAVMAAERDPRAALPKLDTVAEMAAAHAMTEQGGWVDLARAETLFVLGDWAAAIEAAGDAIALGERYAYTRLTFRTWMVLLPMLAARRDAAPLERYAAWWQSNRDHFPSAPSPYARVLGAATAIWLAAANGEPLPVPPDDLVDAVMPFMNPHYLAAVEAVVGAWLEAGRADLVSRVVEAPPDADATPLMAASRALTRAWLADATGNSSSARELAREAVQAAGSIDAAWWLTRALFVFGDPQARALARALGIR